MGEIDSCGQRSGAIAGVGLGNRLLTNSLEHRHVPLGTCLWRTIPCFCGGGLCLECSVRFGRAWAAGGHSGRCGVRWHGLPIADVLDRQLDKLDRTVGIDAFGAAIFADLYGNAGWTETKG